MKLGIYGHDFNSKPICSDGKNHRINMVELLKKLWPGDIEEQLRKLNQKMNDLPSHSSARSRKKSKTNPISQHEFWKFIGILLLARYENVPGGNFLPFSESQSHLVPSSRLLHVPF